jgi:hypothetical protein
MKKMTLLLSLFLVIFFPVIAQDVKEVVPEESLTLKKGNIPPQILKAADELFKGSSQIAWGVFPYELKDYGWVVNTEYNEPIDHYEIHLKTADGSDAYVVFESTGELIRYKLIKKNSPVPQAIMKSIESGPYKDWKVNGDVMLIRNNQKKIVEHYTVNLVNGNMKKTLYFTTKGDAVMNK